MKEITKYKLYYRLDRYLGIPACFVLSLFKAITPKSKQEYNKILVIKLGMIGDAILLVPALRALREKFNQAHIVALCSSANIQIFKNCPYVDEAVAVDFDNLVSMFSLFKLIFGLRKYRFDLAFDFEQWMRISVVISFLSGAKERLGFKTQGQLRHYLFTKSARHIKEKHELECFLDLLKPLGIDTDNKDLQLWPDALNIKEAQNLLEPLKESPGFVVLHAEVSRIARQRQWPLENFAQTAKELIRRYNFKILIAASKKGKDEAERLNRLLDNQAGLLIDIPLLTLYALLPKAELVITNNGGFMHLAQASGARVLALHGPVSEAKWGPWGKVHRSVKSPLSCSPCVYLGFFEFGCRVNKCMQQISVEDVLAQIQDR